MKSKNIKLWLALVWLAFSTAMVLWWWILVLSEIKEPSKHSMLISEGIFFLVAILIGGGALISLLIKDQNRHLQLKNFFHLFSHDLKTSISRLRLQAEILKEDQSSRKNPTLERIQRDINRLDLQLENSLIFSQAENPLLIEEGLLLSSLIESVKNEWDEIEVSLDQDARIRGDRRSLMSVFRNLFHNAMMHGNSQKISIKTKSTNDSRVQIQVFDHGVGYAGDLKKLGVDPFPQSERKGNGIGLFLCRFLVDKQGGKLTFENANELGLVARIEITGSVLK